MAVGFNNSEIQSSFTSPMDAKQDSGCVYDNNPNVNAPGDSGKGPNAIPLVMYHSQPVSNSSPMESAYQPVLNVGGTASTGGGPSVKSSTEVQSSFTPVMGK